MKKILTTGPRASRSFRGPLALVLLAAITAIGLLGYLYYQQQQKHFLRATHKQLSSIADAKVHEITAWIQERKNDADFFREAQLLTAQVPAFLENPTAPEPINQIRFWMARLCQRYLYERVMLVDTQGQLRLAYPEGPSTFPAANWRLGEQALQSNTVVLSDLYQNSGTDAVYLDLLMPVPGLHTPDGFTSTVFPDPAIRSNLESLAEQTAMALLILQIDPRDYLYAQLQSWPLMASSETAETLLVRREGEEVVYLNELRHQTNSTLKLRLPLHRTEVPAVQAVLGREGIFEGRDYRQKPVLAATRKIAGTSWHLITKIDQEEVYAPLRRDAYRIAALAGLLMLITLLGLGMFWYEREKEFTLYERQQKLAALSHMAANVAHEVRNPLTAIKARLFTLTKGLSPASLEHQDATVIGKEIDRIERIVKDYLRFARPPELRLTSLDASEPLKEACELLTPHLCQSDIRLELQPDSAARIEVDPEQLKQVLINLIQNAAEAIGRGGTITLRIRKGTASLHGANRPVVVLEVVDTGPGISSEAQQHLFEPFYSTKPGGSGLGLSIAARIIEKHGGLLAYKTKPNQGTTFNIVLPEAKSI